jgi:hypothetical protein
MLLLVESVQVVLEVVEPKVPLTVLDPGPLDAVAEGLDELEGPVGALLVALDDGIDETDGEVELGDDVDDACTVLLLLGDGLPVTVPPLVSADDGMGVALVSSVLDDEILRLEDETPVPVNDSAAPVPEWEVVELTPPTDVPPLGTALVAVEEALRLGAGAVVPVREGAAPVPVKAGAVPESGWTEVELASTTELPLLGAVPVAVEVLFGVVL